MSMITDTEENLVEFSKKFLDSVFGADTPPDLNLPQIEIPPKKPSSDHLAPPSSLLTIAQVQEEPKLEINHATVQINKRISQDSLSSVQTSESVASSVDSCDAEAALADTDVREAGSRGFETTLKRRSIVALDCDVNGIPSTTDENAGTTNELHIETNNPSHLFWVPAHLHPEIAPNEFKKWLQNHAKDGFHTGPASIKRRKSMLSQQYIPHENDGVDDDDQLEKRTLPEKKSDGFDWESYGSEGNISPAAEVTKLNILRRSLSLNLPPFMESNDLQIFDRNSKPGDDSLVLVPRVFPALKRAARTRIRRNSIAGEQNPRRMSAHRRTRSTHVSSEKDKLDTNAPTVATEHPVLPGPATSDERPLQEEKQQMSASDGQFTSPKKDAEERISPKDDSVPIRITLNDEPELLNSKSVSPRPHRTSSLPPDAALIADALQPATGPKDAKKKTLLSTSNSTVPSSTAQPHKRSTWAWLSWGSSDDKEGKSKKSRAADKDVKSDRNRADVKFEKDVAYDKENSFGKEAQADNDTSRNSIERTDSESVGESVTKEKSKMSLSALFSWTSQNKSKSTEENALSVPPTQLPPSQSQSEPQLVSKRPKYTNYSRLPLHVERAIYRLSHVKLANPRRPLHEQVLISNMMFWYLSLINKQQEEYGGGNPQAQKEAMKVKSKLVKQNPGRKRRKADKKGTVDSKRRHPAEIAYKAPQYDMQQVQIAQQYFAVSDVQGPYQEDYSNYSDGDSDCSLDSADEFMGHTYHHFNDGYTSDGTDGDLLGSDLLGNASLTSEIDAPHPRSPSPNEQPPSPNGRSVSSSIKRPPSPINRPASFTKRGSNPGNSPLKSSSKARMRSQGPAIRNGKAPARKVLQDQASDEDDDVPLGLQFSSTQHA